VLPRDSGANVERLDADISKEDEMSAAVSKLMDRFGRLDVMVANASINGARTFTSLGATVYSATKAAQLAMVQQLALELGRHRIRVNAVCPGAIETNINDSTTVRAEEETVIPVCGRKGGSANGWTARPRGRRCSSHHLPGERCVVPHHQHADLDRWWPGTIALIAKAMCLNIS